MKDHIFDVAVIGAGMAGTSVAAELSSHCNVVLLEQEAFPGYHTTGRSAAVFAPCYGPSGIRSLTRASASFFLKPPSGFADVSLISERPILLISRDDQLGVLERVFDTVSKSGDVKRVHQDELIRLNALLRPEYAVAGILDMQGLDIDVAAMHQGYLRRFHQSGGVLKTNAMVSAIEQLHESWQLVLPDANVRANVIVNAAGAWADDIAELAGLDRIGLIPKRRTAVMIKSPNGINTQRMPITIDIEEQFYLKPEGAQLLISPADETPSLPCDAQPEDIDVAVCIDRISRAFELDINRPLRQWAGLRSFVDDGEPVIGFDKHSDGFFWLAGQGGYGIQTAPALAQLCAAMICDHDLPDVINRYELDINTLLPDRIDRRFQINSGFDQPPQ